jgi:hypothetical protein
MEILKNQEIPTKNWNKFLIDNIFASPFQTPEFYKLFNSIKNLSAEAIAVSNSEQILSLVVITFQKEPDFRSYFSSRGIIYGGPLFDSRFPEASDLILEQISSSFKSNAIYLECRNFSDFRNYLKSFILNGWQYVPYLNFRLNTSDKNSMMQVVSRSRMRQIRKAINCGVNWKEAKNQEEVMSFYEILRSLYKHKIKKPLLPIEFFKTCFEMDLFKFLLVWYNNRIIGGIMCPMLKGKIIYEFYICGLDDDFKEQYPSVMATWAAMEYANQNNISIFDFMGAGKPDDRYGVRDFKARFGGELVEFGRFIKVNKPIMFKIGEVGLKLMKIFPS